MGNHIDTYISPTSWTDLDMSWLPSLTSKADKKAQYLDALVCSIREKKLALGSYWAGLALRPDRANRFSNLTTIHDTIVSLVPSFLNTTTPLAADGTPNYWTLQECLASFGDSVLISPQPYSSNNVLWLRQMYNILNTLRLGARTSTTSNGIYWKKNVGVARYGDGGGWDDIDNRPYTPSEAKDLAVASEVTESTDDEPRGDAYWYDLGGTIGAAFHYVYSSAIMVIDPSRIVPLGATMDIKVYITAQKPTQAQSYDVYAYNFDDCGLGLIEDTPSLVATVADATIETAAIEIPFNPTLPSPPVPPASGNTGPPNNWDIYDYLSQAGFDITQVSLADSDAAYVVFDYGFKFQA